MYEYLTGFISAVTPAYVVLDVNGVGYLLQTANPYRYHEDATQAVTIYVYQAVRETEINLFGFVDFNEKQLFLKLLNVSGIGPKSALAILAAEDHEGLVNAIESKDVTYLTKFPGIGKKTAQQIVLDLQGKLADLGAVITPVASTGSDNADLADALAALTALGYSANEVKKIDKQLADEPSQTTDQYLSKALRLLTNR
ncbi:Holliday junction branch migration protein RuvA [Furfurilactobacillus siliginis]|uniref:Holliday junction branch migration complex subunit RuvA n=1 Tax=Furfurilactobacillus siliginis TaxID=348151 RepID=A0A0R2L9M8_9LACO|nr:Holliday junction branch migration protein RuvA [Furfurilactobacillus siliginis]KRN95453.1 holliday junction DNA helicase RuvA [Furfurilactobacillus siliginis]GEK28226.1 Holliday junction ATP-dependent DNA helicase RuvA [Furfurilactobacillus siliginis]